MLGQVHTNPPYCFVVCQDCARTLGSTGYQGQHQDKSVLLLLQCDVKTVPMQLQDLQMHRPKKHHHFIHYTFNKRTVIRLFTIPYFSLRLPRSSTLCYRQPSWSQVF